MEDRAAIIVSCWFAMAIISVAYMWIFRSELADILVGVFIPVGLLVLVAVLVTFGLYNMTPAPRETKPPSDQQNLASKLDAITKEIEDLKKQIENH